MIGVAGLTADYPAAPLGTFVLAALPEQDLKPADNQTVGERTQVQVAGSVLDIVGAAAAAGRANVK